MTWYDTNYLRKRALTIDHTKVSGGADLTSFPVLISSTHAHFKTIGNGGLIQNGSGFDIIFTDSTETTKLDHEIEQYDGVNGVLVMWVRIPTLSYTVDTVIYCYYDNNTISVSQENKTGVWDANYKGVWHLGETGGTTNADSTTNTANATKISSGHPAPLISGKIDGAQNFDGTGTMYETVSSAAVAITGDKTVAAWVNVQNYAQDSHGVDGRILFQNIDATNVYQLTTWSAGGFVWAVNDSTGPHIVSSNNTGSQYALNIWYYLFGTYTASTHAVTLQINGVSVSDGNASGWGIASSGNLFIGIRQSITGAFNGYLDEPRLSNVVRSAGWGTTSFNSQGSPSTFYTLGPVQTQDVISTLLPAGLLHSYAGGSILPVLVTPSLPCSVNGTVLDTQPSILTTPISTSQLLVVGAKFFLGFMSPSMATQTLLTSGSQVTLQFCLSDGFILSAPVLIESTLSGNFFAVFCTVMQTQVLYRWVIKVQAS